MAEDVHETPPAGLRTRSAVRGERFAARARPAEGDERPPLWERLAADVPQYGSYQRKLGSRRELPVVIVERDQ